MSNILRFRKEKVVPYIPDTKFTKNVVDITVFRRNITEYRQRLVLNAVNVFIEAEERRVNHE